jgi:hypothetical protein
VSKAAAAKAAGADQAASGLPAAVTTAFAKLLGRQPDEVEQLRLFKLKDAFGLSADDETWMFWLGLQHHEWLYEQHPARIEEAVKSAVSGVREAAAAAVKAEVTRATGLLEKEVAKAAASVADARAETTRRMARWWACAGLALFGGFAMVCGFELGRGGLPFWMRRDVAISTGPVARVLGAILGAPAGWAALVALVPSCVTWGKQGWAKANDEAGGAKDRWKGWGLFAGAVLGALAAAAGVFWLVGGIFGSGRQPDPGPRPASQVEISAYRTLPPADLEASKGSHALREVKRPS